jgi:iron complex outermembrane receptor protein
VGHHHRPDTDDWLVLNRGGDYRDVNQYHDQDFAGITGDTSNSNTQMHLLTPTKRRSVFANVQYDLTDNIRFVSDLLYTRRVAGPGRRLSVAVCVV